MTNWWYWQYYTKCIIVCFAF